MGKPKRGPLDDPAVSEQQKAEWFAAREAGRPIGLEPGPPSRSRIGRILDFLERVTGAGQGGRYR